MLADTAGPAPAKLFMMTTRLRSNCELVTVIARQHGHKKPTTSYISATRTWQRRLDRNKHPRFQAMRAVHIVLSSGIASATHQHIRFMLKQQAATTCTERKQLPMNDYSGWDKASSLVDVGVTMFGRTHMFFYTRGHIPSAMMGETRPHPVASVLGARRSS